MSDNPPAPPADNPPAATRTRAKKHQPGDVIQVGDGHALVVGTEKVDHYDERGGKVTRVHPLVVDLPAARRHEADTDQE